MPQCKRGAKVKPLSRRDIRKNASLIHRALGLDTSKEINIIKILEYCLPSLFDEFSLKILPRSEMGENHGLTYPNDCVICIREDVYEGACAGNGRDRFTIAHEIGHLLLHRGYKMSLARGSAAHQVFEDSEWQADAFAGELLMPAKEISGMSLPQIADVYNVSFSAASTQKAKTPKGGGFMIAQN